MQLAGQQAPPTFKLPPRARIAEDRAVVEAFGEANILMKADQAIVKQGRHYHVDITIDGLPENPSHEALWAPFKASLTAAGWTVVAFVDQNPPSATVRYQKPGAPEAWATLTLFAPDDIRVDVIETASNTMTLTLTPPAAAAEKFTDAQPFPYLTPLPGSKHLSTTPEGGPFLVTLGKDPEPTAISEQSVEKSYAEIPGLSTLQFAATYVDALKKAGWTIVEESHGIGQTDAVVVAHYAKNGRDIWAYLHGAGEMSIKVADVGAAPISLASTCHLPLYGVLFDFNKATLKPESDSVLTRALGSLDASPTLNVEVQGHTDNVGGDASNLQLSQARADSVKAWFVAHGVAEARLTAKGYGRSQPIAGNETAEGRAKNRRVEIAKPGCR